LKKKKREKTVAQKIRENKVNLKEGSYEQNIDKIQKALKQIKSVPIIGVTVDGVDVKGKNIANKPGAMYNWDAVIPGQKKTYGEVRNELTIKLIESFPPNQRALARQLIFDASTNQLVVTGNEGGSTAKARKGNLGLYGTKQEFNNAIPSYATENSVDVINRDTFLKNKRLTKQKFNDLKAETFNDLQDKKLEVLLSLIDGIGKISKDKNSGWYIKTLLGSSTNKQAHPLRHLIPLRNVETDAGGNPFYDQDYVEEHNLVSNNTSSLIEYGALTGQLDTVKDIIRFSAAQTLLTDNSDVKVREAGRRQKMGSEFSNIVDRMLAGSLQTKAQGLASLARYFQDNLLNVSNFYNLQSNSMLSKAIGLKTTLNPQFSPNAREIINKLAVKLANGAPLKDINNVLKAEDKLIPQQDKASLETQKIASTLLEKRCTSPCRVPRTSTQVKKTLLDSLKAKVKALNPFKKPKGLSAFDMDDTLALTKEKVIYTLDGKTSELTAGEFAVQYEGLLEQGAEFDYSNFDNVDLSTPKGPLAGTALRRQDKYGSKDIFIVTARPDASQNAIKVWTDSIGLNIPLENIITLEDGSPQAKADWLISKAAEGYNDFYFADDSLLNVQTVKDILGQIDVKSRVQQAIDDKATRLDQEMNDLIEDATDIGAEQLVSEVEARVEGKKRDKGFFKRVLRQFKITASADDFLGLGYYLFGKGEKGTRQRKWFVENLIAPYDKAEQALISAKATVANDFAALKKAFPSLRSKGLKGIFNNPLTDQVGYKSFTKSQAARVYLWNKQGMEIPGMSQTDIDGLVNAVNTDFELQQFADKIQLIQKESQYPAPGANWLAGDIKSDILNSLDKTFRAELLSEWNSNVDIVFSEKNLNKLEKAFGSKYREALEDSIKRMRSGTNRPTYTGSGSRQVNEMMDWLNSSVGVAMFLNMRSGSLQMLSNVNFINWGDNNIYAAAKAFASKDYVPTVMKLMNSDYLVNRRDGLKINVNEAELAAAANKGGFKGMLNFLLDKGFILTRIFDSLAIATGGAPFYINRTKSLLKRVNPKTGKLYTQKEAEVKAFDDFYSIAEETQQSSNPSKISSQQASLFGRTILSYQNVTMQYNRKAKKMLLDFINRRRRPGMTQRESDLSNLSGVMYYVAIQNLIFNSLQQALFAVMFDDEPDEKEKNRIGNTINGMLDSLLFGLGFGGALISTVKNVARELKFQYDRKSPKYEEAVFNLFDISPVLDQKIRNIRTGLRTFSWNMKEIKNRGWSLENPAYLAVSQLISAFTNVPLDRLLRKYNNISQAFDEETRTYEKIALLLGWNGWNFGLPYWGRESTIQQELQDEESLKIKFKADVRKAKADGFTKRVPFTGPNSGKPKGELGVDYVQIERYDGLIQYYKKP